MKIGHNTPVNGYDRMFSMAYILLFEDYYHANKVFNFFVFSLEPEVNLSRLYISFLNGIFDFESHYFICKVCLIVMNLAYIFAQIYSIYIIIIKNCKNKLIIFNKYL